MGKIDLDKFLGALREKLSENNMWLMIESIDAALKQQHIGIYDGIVVEEKEEKLDTIKFEEEPDIDPQKLEFIKTQAPHPKIYYRLLKDELPLKKEGQYIVSERVQVETLEEFRNKVASLEESKPFLPLLDSEIERLLSLEQLHLSHIAGFVVPKEIRFLERH